MIVPSQMEKQDSATAQASTLADPKESSSHPRSEKGSHEDFGVGISFDSNSPNKSPQSNNSSRVITSVSAGGPDIPKVDWACESATIPSSSCVGSGLTSIASDKDEIVPMRRTKQANWSPTIARNSLSRNISASNFAVAGLSMRPSHDESRVDAPQVLTELTTTHAPAEAALVPEVQLIPSFRDLALNWSSTQLADTLNPQPSTSSTDSFRNPFSSGISNPLTCARLPLPFAHQLSSPHSPMVSNSPDHLSLFGPREYAVIKMSNIPWDLTIFDAENFFERISLPISSQQRVHILMNRATGKTLPDAFVEIRREDIDEAIKMDRRYLKGRLIGVSLSSQEELLSHIFPRWQGTWNGVNAVLATGTEATTAEVSSGRNYIDLAFLSYEELNQIIAVCRNYKLFFSRKCAQRPFENIISILMKFPWHQKELIVDIQRNLLFELCKLGVEALSAHFSKDYHHFDPSLMNRLIKSILMVPRFTEKQKMAILGLTNQDIPAGFEFLLRSNGEDSNPSPLKRNPTTSTSLNATSTESWLKTLSKTEAKEDIYPSPQAIYTTPTKKTAAAPPGPHPVTPPLSSPISPRGYSSSMTYQIPEGASPSASSLVARIASLTESLEQANLTIIEYRSLVSRMEKIMEGSLAREEELKKRVQSLENLVSWLS